MSPSHETVETTCYATNTFVSAATVTRRPTEMLTTKFGSSAESGKLIFEDIARGRLVLQASVLTALALS
jgi:hypothetical protein